MSPRRGIDGVHGVVLGYHVHDGMHALACNVLVVYDQGLRINLIVLIGTGFLARGTSPKSVAFTLARSPRVLVRIPARALVVVVVGSHARASHDDSIGSKPPESRCTRRPYLVVLGEYRRRRDVERHISGGGAAVARHHTVLQQHEGSVNQCRAQSPPDRAA